MISLNRSGMNSGVTTSRVAPASETLRTVQWIAPPPKLMEPALGRGGALRRSYAIGLRPSGNRQRYNKPLITLALGRAQPCAAMWLMRLMLINRIIIVRYSRTHRRASQSREGLSGRRSIPKRNRQPMGSASACHNVSLVVGIELPHHSAVEGPLHIRDVGEPDPVRRNRAEVPFDQIGSDGWSCRLSVVRTRRGCAMMARMP